LQRHRPESLRRQYEDFIEQKIEEYKDQLSRVELLGIADEAVRELELSAADQLVLTEVLLLDHVDRLIRKRLRLPTFRRWRERHLRLRRAQQEPTHWGIDAETPLRDWARCLEDGDTALVVGTRIASCAFLLAAYENDVVLIDQQLTMVESVERRAASEGLAGRLHALVVQLGGWFPDVSLSLAVVDPLLLAGLDGTARNDLMRDMLRQTLPGGVHVYAPPPPGSDAVMSFDEVVNCYGKWKVDAVGSQACPWLVASHDTACENP
jgi:hypothetical protein